MLSEGEMLPRGERLARRDVMKVIKGVEWTFKRIAGLPNLIPTSLNVPNSSRWYRAAKPVRRPIHSVIFANMLLIGATLKASVGSLATAWHP